MAVYVVKCDPLSGCLEPVKVSGNESLTLGCVWNSNDVAATINDCDGCQLAQLNQTSVALGVDASALNNGVSVGKSSSTTCTSIAIGCGATSYDNGIAIGANLTACCDEILIGDKVVITDNTVINGCDGGCSNVVAINATATDNCQVVINGLVDVNTDGVSLGYGNIYTKVCCDCIDVKGCTAVLNVGTNSVAIGANATTSACSTAIGYCACATNGSVAIGTNATATCGIDIKGGGAEVCIDFNGGAINIGYSNVICNLSNTTVGSFLGITNGVTDAVIIGQANSIPSGCTLDGVTLIGDLGELGVDYQETVGSGDVVIGTYICNPFHYCASNGYTYSGSCLMTGRIINCTDLPATCCENILFVVP